MRRFIILFLSILLIHPSTVFAKDKLIFAIDLIRHGDRTPISPLPNSDHVWKQGLGQLTATGMAQEHALGKKFRKRYVDNYHLLPKQYKRGTMYVRSTDIERTLMSAQSVLLGLYPLGTGPYQQGSETPGLPQAFQPIPIHTAPTYLDDMIIHQLSQKESSELFKKYVASTAKWQRKEASLSKYFQRWSEQTGMKISGLYDVMRLSDTLIIHRFHHIPIPGTLTEEEIDNIIAAGDWAFMYTHKPKPIADAKSHQLVSKIAKFLKKAADNNSKLKYVLLSAHDSTIASALSALGAPLDDSPPYSSDLNILLFEKSPYTHYVVVSYNDKPYTLPGCHEGVCSLDKFIQLTE